MSKVIKRDLPQFLANRIEGELGSLGYTTLMDMLTLSEYDYVARVLNLASRISDDNTDLLAVIGQYICDGYSDSTVNIIYTEWDELLKETLRVNKLMETLESRLVQEISAFSKEDAGNLHEIMRFDLCLEKSRYDYTYSINLNMSTSDDDSTRVFNCSFDNGFLSYTSYPKRFWQEKLWNRLVNFDDTDLENIVESMEEDIESAIFDLLYHLNKVSTKAIPGRVLVEKFSVPKTAKKTKK